MCSTESPMEYADCSRQANIQFEDNLKQSPSKVTNFSTSEIFQKDADLKTPNSPNPRATFVEETVEIPESPSVPTIRLNDHRIPMHALPLTSNLECYYQQAPECSEFDYHSETSWSEENVDVLQDENSGRCGNRGRTTYTDEQISALEKAYAFNAYPNSQSRQLLASIINVPEGKVKIWFQNRRARAKKQKITPSSWRREGKAQHRPRDSLTDSELNEEVQENQSCKNVEREKNSSARYLNPLPLTPISLSDLNLGGCKSTISTSFSTKVTAAVALTSSSTIPRERTDLPWRSEQNTFYQRFNKHCISQSQPHSYSNYPSSFPVIKQPALGFSANYNQNSSNSQFASAYDNCFPGLSSFTSSFSAVNSTPAWFNQQGNRSSNPCYQSNAYSDSQSSSTQYNPVNKTTPTTLPIETSPDLPVPLSPPPIRRLVFPFETLSQPVEHLQQNIIAFAEQKLRREENSTKDSVIPECSRPSSSLLGRSNLGSPPTAQETNSPDFTLHGMDHRHETSRRRSIMHYSGFSSGTNTQTNECSTGYEINSSAVQTPAPIQSWMQDKNADSASSCNGHVPNGSAGMQWPHHNYDLLSFFDNASAQATNPADSLNNNCCTTKQRANKSPAWKVKAGASSASVVG